MIRTASQLAGRATRRRGTVVSLMALCIVALLAFLGMAIDLGMLAIAKAQAQNAADLASLTAARTLSGDSSNTYNYAQATTNAQNILTHNVILGQTIQSGQLSLSYGSYDYNSTTQMFNANFPATQGMPYTAVAATVTSNPLPGAFSRVLGSQFLPTVTALATAVHRPRDMALVMDLSSSMRYGSMLGYDIVQNTRATNNPDTTVPTFGHYSSSGAVLVDNSSNRISAYDSYTITPSNTTTGNASYTSTYINTYYQNDAYASTWVRAFDSYSSADSGKTWSPPSSQTPQLPPATYTTTPGGDVPLFSRGSTTTYAKTVSDVWGSSSRRRRWELDGYSSFVNGSDARAANGLTSYPSSGAGAFYGYTQGPGYYGKTFFIWPPDPRRHLDSANGTISTAAVDAALINQFLLDFGYTAADFSNTSVATTLTSNITRTTQTFITVNSSSFFPTTVPFKIVVGSEIMKVTAVAGVAWTVARGQDGTTAAASVANGTPVYLGTGAPLYGIYGATPVLGNATSGSQSWPWPNDGGTGAGTTLSNYLTSSVYIPGSSVRAGNPARTLTASDTAYQKIMRLYSWDYVIDTVGTTSCDWRVRFFGTNDNTKLFAASGSLATPSASTYTINYNEILRWLTQTPNPFPIQMRAGRVKYYGSIPSSITGTWPDYGGTDQRFWVEMIDHMLGFRQTAAGVYSNISAMAGYGPDFTWGTVSLTGVPSTSPLKYMSYTDNPARPLLRHWFSPILMVDYLHNYNMYQNVGGFFVMQPGDSYEAPIYSAREAFQAAINTMEYNHPNDWFTLTFYSQPRNSSVSLNRFNCVGAPLGTNYAYARSALYFPFSTINADGTCNSTEVTPYDPDPVTGNVPSANFIDTPRPKGGTCFAMGLMLAYNQFAVTPPADTTLRTFVTSSPITFPTGMAGGMGRRGAQKVVVFETDGLANASATASLVSGGSYNYYQIRYDMNRPGSSEYPASIQTTLNDPAVLSQVYSLVDQLKNDYGTTRNPFRLYAIGFGPVFAAGAPDAQAALTTLQTMQYRAGTQSSASTPLPSAQIITGTDAQMSANMIATYTSILQSGVQIALIK
jgi:Flp pilus assembly protein TadG